MKDLIRFVQQDSNLKSATDESDDPGFKFDEATGTIELTLDFLVDRVIPFNNSAIKRICGKGILRRAEGYSGTMMEVGADVDQSFEATIDGANVKSTEPTILVKEGGTLRYNGVMKNLLLGSVEISLDPSGRPAILNQGNTILESGSIDGAVDGASGSDLYENSMVNNSGTLTLTGGEITGGITNSKQLIIDEKVTVPLSVEYIRCERSAKDASITIASKLHNKYRLIRLLAVHSTAPGSVPKYFSVGEVIAQGTENYQVTEQDAENLLLATDLRKVIEGNQIVLREQEDAEFNLQALINAATGTADNPTVITIPEEGIRLSETVTIEDKHVKLTGGTITADYSKEKFLRLLLLKSGSLTLEEITIDGDKETAAKKDSWGVLIQQNGGVCNLKKGAVLQNALGMWDFYNTLIVNGGVCYMEKDARIQFNECKLGGTVGVYNGRFVLRGGYIFANNDGYNGETTTDLQFGMVYVKGTMEFLDGDVSHDYVSIGVEGNLIYDGDVSEDAIKMFKGGVITLKSSLTKRVDMLLSNDDSREPKVGDIIVKGTDNYKLTASDLANLKMPEGYGLKQQDNTFVLAKEGETGGIGSLKDLIEAVSTAPTGTADNPTVLNITTAGIDFDQTLEIKGKHIKLVGNSVVYRNVLTSSLCLFKISNGGSLTIESGTISGTKDGTNAFNTAAYVYANSTLILNNVTIQKFVSDLATWSMLRIYGRCELNNCTIADNRGKAMIFVGSQGSCQITGGRIQRNSCLNEGKVSPLIYSMGTLVYSSGEYTDNHAISIQSMGTTSLLSPHIQNYLSELIRDEGSFICVYNNLIYDDANIGDSFMLETDGKTRGYISLCKALKRTLELVCHDVEDGWVAVRGLDYKLTQADLEKIVLAKALADEYTLQMVDNTFVLKAKNSGKDKYNVTVEACKNGTLTTNKTTAAKGEQVTITAKPAKGYKLYVDQLCYNRYYQLQPVATMANVFSFSMPSTHAHVEAEFIPEDINVVPPDLGGFNPDTDVTPGKGFGNLDSLISVLGGKPEEIRPEAKPLPNDELPGALRGEIDESTENGNEHIGSLRDLINLVSGGQKTVLQALPCKVRMTFYLPKSRLRASTEKRYYILNESEGKVTTIIPEYDPENNTLLFETDKLGVFAVMYGNSATANEEIVLNALRIVTKGDQISIANLPAGVSYTIYNLSGRIVCNGIGDGSLVSCSVEKGIYIIKCGGAAYKVIVR